MTKHELEDKRRLLKALIENGNKIIDRKIDMIKPNINEKSSLQLKAINERIKFFSSKKYIASKTQRWDTWYNLVETEANTLKSIDDYYQIIPLESALRSNKKINPLLLNQNNKLLNDKLKDLTDILYQVRKEKLAYKLKMSSFFNLKLYASNMISAIVVKNSY